MNARPSSVALWCGILAGPLAWATDLQLRYALVPWACERGHMSVLTLISVPLLLVALMGALLSWRGLRAGEDDAYDVRVRFMGISGVMLSLAFSLTIIAMTIPDFFLRPCS
jgi:hypothetical protein